MASTNPTPNQVYVSNSVPFGGFFINLYRGQSAPALLGVYRVTSFTPQRAAVVTDRPDVDGGDNGWTMVAGVIEGGINIQLATDATPTVQPGDFFKTSVIFRNAAGAATEQIVVVKEIGPNIDQSYRTQSGSARVDQFPDATVSAIVEYSGS